MKNFLSKFISSLLIFLFTCTSGFEAFALSNKIPDVTNVLDVTFRTQNSQKEYASETDLKKDYDIVSEVDTEFGKMYFIAEKWAMQTRASFWDVVDIAMAVDSWAKLFGQPSGENFGWAILDTVSLLPLIPSLKYVKNAEEAAKKVAEYAKKSKSNAERVLKAFKVGGDKLSSVFMKVFGVAKITRFPTIVVTTEQLKHKIKHAYDLGVTHHRTMNNVSGFEQAQILERYRKEVLKILHNRQKIYEYSVSNTPTYAFVYWRQVVQIRRDNFQFITAFTANNDAQLYKIKNSLEVIPGWWLKVVSK